MNSLELRAALSVGLLYLVRMLGLFMVLPVIAVAAESYPDATPMLVGIAIGAYGLTQAVLQIPMGKLSDSYGRKPVLLIALGVFVAGSLVAAMSTTLTGLILGRLLQGCGAIASTLLALLADLTRVEHRSKSMAIVGGCIGLSFGVSLLAGPWIFASAGIEMIFFISAALGFVSMLVVYSLPRAVRRVVNRDNYVDSKSFSSLLSVDGLPQVLLGIFFAHFFLVAGFSYFPGMFLVMGYEVTEHSLIYLGVLLGSIIVMIPLIWMADRAARTRNAMLVAIFLIGVSLLCLSFFGEMRVSLLAIVLFFGGFNSLEAILPAHLSRLAPAGMRGTAMGMFATCQFLGIFAGGFVSGLILGLWDEATFLWVNAAAVFLWLLVMVSIPNAQFIASRTISLGHFANLSANQILERLSSLQGVLEVVVIDEDHSAYLKVDTRVFDESKLGTIGD